MDFRIRGQHAGNSQTISKMATVSMLAGCVLVAFSVFFASTVLALPPLPPTPYRDESGLPFLPFGFYSGAPIRTQWSAQLPLAEAGHGLTLACPYASVAAPDAAWHAEMRKYLDLAAASGVHVHFALNAFQALEPTRAVMGNLTAIVTRYKAHPALLGWYLADEPDGGKLDPALLVPKYNLIKKLDPHHPVSMVFNLGGSPVAPVPSDPRPYLSALDVAMVDPYPVPNFDAGSVANALAVAASLGKPFMLVPQAFGGGEAWQRTPTGIEERLMTYLGLIYGAVGIQYFIRGVGANPYAQAAWSEVRILAMEVRELQGALLGVGLAGDAPVRPATRLAPASLKAGEAKRSGCNASAASWLDRDGSVVVLAAEKGKFDGLPCVYNITVTLPAAAAGGMVGGKGGAEGGQRYDVLSMFEDRAVVRNLSSSPASSRVLTFTDSFRSQATGAYRIVPVAAETTTARSPFDDSDSCCTLVNPSFELSANAASPDGNYVTPSSGALALGSTFFSDSRNARTGRHSLRLHSSNGTGVTLQPFPFDGSAFENRTYEFSFAIRGAKGGETVDLVFGSLFARADNGGRTVSLVAEKFEAGWQRHSVNLTGQKHVPGGSHAGWLKYALQESGDVWLDDLGLLLLAER